MLEGKWYVAYTQPGRERKVAELLTKKKIQNYCPLNKVDLQFSNGKKKAYSPLFTSNVFAYLNDLEQLTVKQIPGIINLVYWLGNAAVISDDEITAIKEFINEYPCVKLEKTHVKHNDAPLFINAAPFKKGNLLISNNTAKVILPSLGHTLVAEVGNRNFTEINHRNFTQITYFENSTGREVAV